MNKCVSGIIAAAGCIAVPAAAQAPGDIVRVERFLRATVGQAGEDRDARYAVAFADLNGDRRHEAIVHLVGSSMCGSGGCEVLVLSPTRTGYRLVGDMSVSRTPIRVLATRTRGWLDLGVAYSGGGMRPGIGRMRFDGSNYADNPTVAPAASAAGRIVIPQEPEYRDLYR